MNRMHGKDQGGRKRYEDVAGKLACESVNQEHSCNVQQEAGDVPPHGIWAEELVVCEQPQEKERAVINTGFSDGFPSPDMAGEEGRDVVPRVELPGVHDLAIVVVDEIKMESLGKDDDGDGDKYGEKNYAEERGARRAKGLQSRRVPQRANDLNGKVAKGATLPLSLKKLLRAKLLARHRANAEQAAAE